MGLMASDFPQIAGFGTQKVCFAHTLLAILGATWRMQDLSSDIGTSYNLLWTIDSAQNGASLMTGAMDVQQDGWAAFGFPQTAGSGMLGGSALLVKKNASSPSGVHHC